MIEPEVVTPYDLRNKVYSGKLFVHYAGSKYLLYDEGTCIFEVISNPAQGYCLCGKDYEEIKDIFIFLDQIKAKYPEVADWFLFNIKKFT